MTTQKMAERRPVKRYNPVPRRGRCDGQHTDDEEVKPREIDSMEETMSKKIISSLIAGVILIIILMGCNSRKTEVSVDGELADGLKMEQYIDVANQYWAYVYELGEKPHVTEQTDSNNTLIETEYEVNYKKAQMYISYSADDWQKEYYKTLIIRNQLFSEEDIEDQIKSMVDVFIEMAIEEGEITYIDDYSILNISDMMKPIENKYKLSYEDSVNSVLRPFLESLCIYDTFKYYYAANLYKGNTVEWNGSNTDEYKAYIDELYMEYDAYIEELYEQAEVQIN